jgi:GTP-binding protein
MSGLIAIVGRPNVGKSALFNRIVGRRIAIVHDQPGVTRDRISAEAEWHGRPFTLVDTGGIGLLRGEKAADPIVAAAVQQVQIAIDAAQVILFVGDAKDGVAPLDREVAGRLRASGKPVLVVANKVDGRNEEPAADEFAELGFGPVFAVSAIHGRGVEPLLDAALALLPQPVAAAAPPGAGAVGPALKLAIIGRPNVGKSSIINALTQSDRVIVSPIPGTTRDSVDVPFEVETEGVRQRYVLIDTAGMRKDRRVDNSIEFFSVKRAEESIHRCDLVVFVLDAESGILEQDKKIADKIVEAHKACVVVVNKWDLMEADVAKAREEEIQRRERKERRRDVPKAMTTLGEFGQWVQERLFFLDYAPVIFTSAKSGFHLDRLLEAIRYVTAQLRQTVPTALLNRTLQEAVERQQPVSNAGHFLKFFYATQFQQAPPGFLLFVNRDELFSEPYRKYLVGQLRKAFGFEGCPILLHCRARPKKVESIRRATSHRSGERPESRSRRRRG